MGHGGNWGATGVSKGNSRSNRWSYSSPSYMVQAQGTCSAVHGELVGLPPLMHSQVVGPTGAKGLEGTAGSCKTTGERGGVGIVALTCAKKCPKPTREWLLCQPVGCPAGWKSQSRRLLWERAWSSAGFCFPFPSPTHCHSDLCPNVPERTLRWIQP